MTALGLFTVSVLLAASLFMFMLSWWMSQQVRKRDEEWHRTHRGPTHRVDSVMTEWLEDYDKSETE